MLLLGLCTPDPAVFPSIKPSGVMDGGRNDPFVYIMHCCGWYSSGCLCLNPFGKGIIWVLLVWVVLTFGAVFQARRI